MAAESTLDGGRVVWYSWSMEPLDPSEKGANMTVAQASIVHKALQAELRKIDRMDRKAVWQRKYDNELLEE